jgi:hypothetical protein
MESQPIKPPLGIAPRAVHDAMRANEIFNALLRYCEAEKTPPREWIEELRGLYETKK